MDKSQLTVADFYSQLALLVRSRLPLPDSLYQLAQSFNDDAFRSTIETLGRETAAGTPLHKAMSHHPELFSPLQIRLIEAGEKTGTLDELLFEVARSARDDLNLVNRVREIAIYPLFVIWISILVYALLLRYVVPSFGDIFSEMLRGEPLPGLTVLILSLSSAVCSLWPVVIVLLTASFGFILWAVGQGRNSTQAVARFVRLLPGGRQIMNAHDYCRLTRIWGMMLERGLSVVDGLRHVAASMAGSDMGARVADWAERSERGESISDVVTTADKVDGLLALTVEHADEAELPRALSELSHIYDERAASAASQVTIFWSVVMTMLMACVAGGIVLALFMPLIKLIDSLGG